MLQLLPCSPQGAFPDLIPEDAQRALAAAGADARRARQTADGALALQLECEARMRAEGQVAAAAPPRSESTLRVGKSHVFPG